MLPPYYHQTVNLLALSGNYDCSFWRYSLVLSAQRALEIHREQSGLLLKVFLPYHKGMHVLNIAYNMTTKQTMSGGH